MTEDREQRQSQSNDAWGGCNCDQCSADRYAVWRALVLARASNVQAATERFDDTLAGKLNPSPASTQKGEPDGHA